VSWEHSLVKISTYHVDVLRKRLVAIAERRMAAELGLTLLHAELEAERARGDEDAHAGWYRIGYAEGWRVRRETAESEIAAIEAEETGARDALTAAYQELKKYEQVAEGAARAQSLAAARRDRAAMDELGLRRAVG
jgi:flagellar export protein FliJ